MNASLAFPSESSRRPLLLISAWGLMLLMSDLPNILLNYSDGEPTWLPAAKVAVPVAFLGITLLLKSLRPLWRYALIFLVFYLARSGSVWVSRQIGWQGWFHGQPPSFFLAWLAVLLPDLALSAAMIAVTWIVKRQRSAFFLAKGKLDAPLEPVRWLGVHPGKTWKTFGLIFSGCIFGGIAAFASLTNLPLLGKIGQALPLLPAILLLSALNSAEEELSFRSPLVATTQDVIGRGSSLWLSAVFFGLAHSL